MKLASKALRSAATTAIFIAAIYSLGALSGFGTLWQLGLLGLLISFYGITLLAGTVSAFRTGEIHSLGIDWERGDYYFKLIVAIHLLLAGFCLWFGIYFLQDLVSL